MSILNNSIVPASAGGYEIDNSLRFNDDDSAYLSWTPSSAGDRKTWTWSGWVKRGNLGSAQAFLGTYEGTGTVNTEFRFNSNDTIDFVEHDGAVQARLNTTQVFRDVSSWYHIVLVFDTSNTTSSDRVRLYVNGARITDFSIETYPAQDFTGCEVNTSVLHKMGRWYNINHLDGYLAEVNFIDGQALDPSDFGETGDYGEWKPIEYTGTYGTNGFYLDFGNSGSLGADSSGNSNNWTPNNLAATDQMLDSPTNNFCTMNSASPNTQTLSEGGLKSTGNTGRSAVGTFPMISGKWYWEFYWTGGNNEVRIGLTDDASNGGYGGGIHAYSWTGNVANYLSGGNTNISCSPSITQNSIIGFAWDADAGELKAFVNGTAINSGAALLTGFTGYTMMPHGGQGAGGFTIWYNFGQDSSFAGNKTAQGNTDDNGIGDFYYEPPTGFNALCTQNLDDPDVIPSEHFNTVLYTGDGSAGRAITGVGFAPNLSWLKRRDVGDLHPWSDSVRGGNKTLFSNLSNAENTSTNMINSLDSDGFTVGNDAGVNANGGSYVAWNWKANGSDVLNENGTIDSQVSANQDAGFSIVSYTGNGVGYGSGGATIGHGLSSKPQMIIAKRRDSNSGWVVYTETTDATDYLQLDGTAATADYHEIWADTEPTSSLFTVGNAGNVNANGGTYIAYAFHSVDGYSKVGSYTANGSTDGTFAYCGFKPAMIIIKNVSRSQEWIIKDIARDSINPNTGALQPNSSGAESTAWNDIDFLSNGFKLRTSGDGVNYASGDTMIFYAVAEQPFKYTNGE